MHSSVSKTKILQITHLMGRILGQQGLTETPIDTNGFQSVLRLIDTTTADSFDLFCMSTR